MDCPEEQHEYAALQERLGVHFDRPELLVLALTHRSFVSGEEGGESNERLEFLGDAVLDLIIAEELFLRYPEWPEGELTKAKASAVGERSLEQVARRWELGRFVRISHGEDLSGGRERRALLADTVEAVIGAYFLDQGLPACREVVVREMAPTLDAIARQEHNLDYKTQLQEYCQACDGAAPSYQVIEESGPAHDRTFEVAVSFHDAVLGVGSGKSKKEAEQQAAARALETVRDDAGSNAAPDDTDDSPE